MLEKYHSHIFLRALVVTEESKTVFENSLSASAQGTIGFKKKLRIAERQQITMEFSCLDELIDEDHRVRSIWKYVELANLEKALERVQTYQDASGRSAIDPKILLALWLYATIEGYGSAYNLEKLCQENIAYKWICGGVSIGRKTLSNFRIKSGDILESILINGVTALIKANVVDLEEISQDGLKVKACASEKSYRNKKSIAQVREIVQEHITRLKNELETNPSGAVEHRKKMKLRRLQEKQKRLEEAYKEVESCAEKKDAAQKRDRKKKLTDHEKAKIKVSTTDPQARLMKMPQGGYKLAMNCEFAMDTKSGFIVGTRATNQENDSGQVGIMFDYLRNSYGITPKRYLADAGFRNNKDTQRLYENGCEVFMPIPIKEQKVTNKNSEGVVKWKERMQTQSAKETYSRRASTIEWFNAGARQRGLQSFSVRGLEKGQVTCNLQALAHNIQRMRSFKLI